MSERNGNAAGWVRTTLDAIGTLYCGQSPPSKAVNGDGKGTVYVTGPEQWDGKRILIDKWTTDPRRIVPDGCIFVTVKGAGVGTIFPGIASAIGRDIYAYYPSESVLPAFIQYTLHATIDMVKRQAKGDIPGLTKDHLLKHEIGLPPLAEQRRIVAKIEVLQERSRRAREALSEMGSLLEQFRQSVLAAAFRGDLTADWRAAHPNVEPASELLYRIRAERRRRWEQAELAKYEAKGQEPPKNWKDKYKEPEPVDDSGLPELPAGWVWSTLATISVIQSGITLGQKKQAGVEYVSVPYLRVANVQRGYLDLSEIKTIEIPPDRLEQLRLQDGDLLFNEGGDRDKLGRGWIWRAEIEDCIHQNHVFRARLCSNELIQELISYYANEFGQEFFFRHASQTVNLASINKTQLSNFAIPIMPTEEQQVLNTLLNRVLESVNELQSISNIVTSELDSIDQSTLVKAFRGELVPQDPNDEPASLLLERIEAQRKQQAEAIEKTFKMRRRNKMEKKSSGLASHRRLLAEVLAAKGKPMPPERLLTEAGYDDGSIEDFYLALREEIKKGRIREGRPSEGEVMLEAIEP